MTFSFDIGEDFPQEERVLGMRVDNQDTQVHTS
jgi:hypothetical protein